MKLGIGLLIASMLLISCNSNSSLKSIQLVNLDKIIENEGFIDIPLTIVEQSSNGGYLINKVQAISQNDTLELLINLKEGVPPGFVNGTPKNMFLEKGIEFESTGNRSDMLLTVLSRKYGLDSTELSIKNKQIFTCANLNQAPINYKSGTPKFKIFLEDEKENAELFVNFDFKNATVSLSEKDPGYRNSLINLMKK